MIKSGVLLTIFVLGFVFFFVTAGVYLVEYLKLSDLKWTHCHTTQCTANIKLCFTDQDWGDGPYPVSTFCTFEYRLNNRSLWTRQNVDCASSLQEGVNKGYEDYPRNISFLCAYSTWTDPPLWLMDKSQTEPFPIPLVQLIVFSILALVFGILSLLYWFYIFCSELSLFPSNTYRRSALDY